jgi:hypothetical protein
MGPREVEAGTGLAWTRAAAVHRRVPAEAKEMWVMEQFEFLTLLDDDAEPQQSRPSVLGGPEAALGLDSVSNLDELTGVFDDFAISSW